MCCQDNPADIQFNLALLVEDQPMAGPTPGDNAHTPLAVSRHVCASALKIPHGKLVTGEVGGKSDMAGDVLPHICSIMLVAESR